MVEVDGRGSGRLAATAAMYKAVEAVSEGSVAMRTVMEKEGL